MTDLADRNFEEEVRWLQVCTLAELPEGYVAALYNAARQLGYSLTRGVEAP